MKLKYRFEFNDLLAFQNHYSFETDYGRKAYRGYILKITSFMIVFILFSFVTLDWLRILELSFFMSVWGGLYIAGLTLVVIGLLIKYRAPIDYKRAIRKNLQVAYPEDSRAKVFGDCSLELKENEIFSTSPFGRGQYLYSQLNSVVSCKNHLFVFVTHNTALIINKESAVGDLRAFEQKLRQSLFAQKSDV